MDGVERRSIAGDAKLRLSALLDLRCTGEHALRAQDWDLECSDAERVDAFLDAYERPPARLDDDERFALMALIVASLDMWLDREELPRDTERALCARLRHLLLHDMELHRATVAHWCCPEEPDPLNGYAITPLMRAVANEAQTPKRDA